MDYLLKASGIVIILFLFYYIFLKNETFFKSIRSYFLVGLIIVVSIPLIEIPVYVETITNQLNTLNYQEIISTPLIEEKTIDWTQILTSLYLIGVIFFSIKFLIQLISLTILLSKHQLIKKGKYRYVETSKNISPFSFFNIIIYNKNQFSIQELEQIINHEKAHVIQWHSLDTILAHLMVITLWFNPFVWLYKKAVQQNLEFLADAHALKQVKNHKLYQFTLLKTCSTNFCTELTNNFYNSLIKKRIIMLHKNQSPNKSQWKYMLLLPIFIAFVMAFNTKIVAQEKKLVKVEELKIEIIIDKNSTDADFEQEKTTFKNEANIDLIFKGIKRNNENEITAIKIEAKGENVKAKFENSGTVPIKPIKISYDSKNNAINIGNISKAHKGHYSYTIHEEGDVKFKGKPNKDGNYVFVTSDGETTSWTSKSSDTIIHENKIIIKSDSDNEHVWVHKNNDKNHNVEVKVIEVKDGKKIIKIIEDGKDIDIEKEYNIEIIEKSDNDSENVFIIKKDGDKTIEHKSGNNLMFISEGGDSPIFIIDGKETSKEEMEKLGPDSIESVSVLKGESANNVYGEKGKNGVILITTKKQ